MTYIGIDPGKAGGIAIFGCDAFVQPTPTNGKDYDVAMMWHILSSDVAEVTPAGERVVVTIEKASPVYSANTKFRTDSQSFRIGYGYGVWHGLVTALGYSLIVVTPQKWKKLILDGTAKDKDAAIRVASQRWPDMDFRKSTRCRKLHDGLCEAALIAEVGKWIDRAQVPGKQEDDDE